MHQYIVDTLTPLGIEIAWSSYIGDADHYLIFSIYQEDETEVCDDQYLFERFYLTVSYWFKSPEYLDNKNKLIKKKEEVIYFFLFFIKFKLILHFSY